MKWGGENRYSGEVEGGGNCEGRGELGRREGARRVRLASSKMTVYRSA